MKSFLVAAVLPVLIAGNPVTIESRQTGTTAKEFTQGGCAENIFIFSRGSTEPGNMACFPPSVLKPSLMGIPGYNLWTPDFKRAEESVG